MGRGRVSLTKKVQYLYVNNQKQSAGARQNCDSILTSYGRLQQSSYFIVRDCPLQIHPYQHSQRNTILQSVTIISSKFLLTFQRLHLLQTLLSLSNKNSPAHSQSPQPVFIKICFNG